MRSCFTPTGGDEHSRSVCVCVTSAVGNEWGTLIVFFVICLRSLLVVMEEIQKFFFYSTILCFYVGHLPLKLKVREEEEQEVIKCQVLSAPQLINDENIEYNIICLLQKLFSWTHFVVIIIII